MDALPVAFYEKIAYFASAKPEMLRNCGALTGCIGSVAVEHTDKQAFYLTGVVNGHVQRPALVSLQHGFPLKSTKLKHLFVAYVAIRDETLSNDNSTIDCKVPDIIGNVTAYVTLESPTISKVSERLIHSIKSATFLEIYVPITEQVLGILDRTVQKKTLIILSFENGHQLDEKSKQLLFSLLKQDQFYEAMFSSGCHLSLEDVIAEWMKNSQEMVGKSLYFESNLCTELGSDFRLCSEDELSDLRRFYNVEIKEGSKSFVLKRPNRRAIYGQFDNNCMYRTRILFA